MVTENQNIEEMIAVYLSGNASPEQAIVLEEWKSENLKNNELFLQYEKLYSVTHSQNQFSKINIDEQWGIQLKNKPTGTQIIPLWKNRTFYTAVAAIGILALLAYNIWGTNPIDNGNKIANKNQTDSLKQIKTSNTLLASNGVESFTLKDKSIVELQAGSKLIFDKNFNKKDRKLTLTGSGTFNVTHDEKSPFILKVNKLEIHDIGTIFKVQTYADTIKIVVYEGAVELRLNNQIIEMVEGDSSFYLIEKQIITRYKQPSDRQDKIFKFDGTSLSEVARVLSGFFNQKIVIANKEIENCPLSVTFKNENLATILDIIKELLDLEITKRNNIIEIHGKGC